MSSHSIQSLYTSTISLKIESTKIIQYIKQYFRRIILYPSFFDIDYNVFCKHYTGVIDFARSNLDSGDSFIKDKILELPELSEDEFRFSTFGLPVPILYTILFPLGLIALGQNYSRLSALLSKLEDIERILGTSEFMLKAAVS